MSSDLVPKLFQPVKIGDITLGHRVVMAPLTRYRANKAHVHSDLGVEYYAQRASSPGTLIIGEATFVSAKAGGYANAPGIWNDAQIAAWKKITSTVHAKGSFMYLQLWALGRAANPGQLKEEGDLPYVSASAVPLTDVKETPRALTEEEIQEYIEAFANAASNAVHKAGFDGVEIHSASGYFVDQFLQDVSNKRTDRWGGSIENRCRFALEIIAAVVSKIGANKTGIRVSPYNGFNDMGMEDPVPTFTYLISQIAERFPELAYLHFVEPRVRGYDLVDAAGKTNDIFFDIWKPRPFLSGGGLTRETALQLAEKGQLAVFGRRFISNPDLPTRLRENIPLTDYDRNTFYSPEAAEGYIDYPFFKGDVPVDVNPMPEVVA